MDIKKIADLAKIINEYGLTRIKITEGSTVIQLDAEKTIQTPLQQACAVQTSAPVTESAAPVIGKTAGEGETVQKSPAVGTVYLSSGQDTAPYVNCGDKVKKGQTLCLIESMKMFSDMRSEYDGTIKEICVENGQTIGIGQPLFIIAQEQK